MRAALPAHLRVKRQQRMTRAAQGEGRVFPFRADRGADAVKGRREPALGQLHVQPDQQVPCGTHERQFIADDAGQIAEHLALFLALLALELLQAVVLLHKEERLEIAGLARIGIVVDDALNAALEIGFEGQDVAVGGQRHVIVLQILGDVVLDREILDLAQAHEMQTAQLAAHEHELGGAFVLDEAVVSDAAAKGGEGHLRQGHGGDQIAQGRPQGSVFIDGLHGPPRLRQRFAQGPQRVGVKRRVRRKRALKMREKPLQIGEIGKPESALARPRTHLVEERVGGVDGVDVAQGKKAESDPPARFGHAQGGEMFEHLAEFQSL